MTSVSDLLGKTLTDVKNVDNEDIVFTLDDGRRCKLHHWQSCCESVGVEDIIGDLSDLVGSPLTMAEEVSSEGVPPKDPDIDKYGSYTWTFYKFATVKGYVTIRFYGTSNGFYSESVDFDMIED